MYMRITGCSRSTATVLDHRAKCASRSTKRLRSRFSQPSNGRRICRSVVRNQCREQKRQPSQRFITWIHSLGQGMSTSTTMPVVWHKLTMMVANERRLV